MNAVATVANCAWLAASVPAWRRFCRGLRRPAETQQRVLRRLLSDNAASAYGRQYGFDEIRSYEQFRERVPMVDYESVEPWVSRIVRGERGVLTREPVARLLPTSGSSGARKLIPFTSALQQEINAAIAPWMVDLSRAYPAVPFGSSYWSISPTISAASEENSAVPIGFDDDSAYLGGIRRRLVEATFAVPSALRLVTDFECFRYVTLLCLLRQPSLRLISIWHPSFLALLLDALPQCWDELIKDIESGGCVRAQTLSADVRRALRASPRPRRADELRRAGPANPHALWPHLSVVSCWGDGQAALALSDLRRRLPHVALQSKGLLATEACVSIPFQGLHPIAVTSHFFEFADAEGGVRRAHELRSGESYTVIVSTSGGLWRYRLGDLVEVDGIIGSTPSLRFLGRGGSVSDLCGEKLAEPFVTRALAKACTSSGFAPRFATLAPELDAAGHWHYTLFVEGEIPDGFHLRLDAELRANPHYALCRDLQQLGPLRCFHVASGAYEAFCRVRLSEGRRFGEIKPVNLSSQADWRRQFVLGG